MRHAAARRVRVGALLAVAALLTSACADGPAQPGTAAYVGSATVSVDELQAQVDAVLAYRDGAPTTGEGATDVRDQLPQVTQQVLSQGVLRELVAAAVTRTGLQVDEAAVTEQLGELDSGAVLGQASQAYLTPDTLDTLVRDQLVLVELGRQAWDGLAVTVDLVTATDRGDAVATAQRMAVDDAASAQVVEEATTAGEQAEQALALTPATGSTLAATPLFAAPAGSAVAFQLQGQAPQWFAARILTRVTDAEASTAEGAVTADAAEVTDALSLGLSLLPALAGDPEVRLNPRYGQWDATAARVIPESDVPAAVVVRA